jgi:hypothetical protein
VEKYFIADTRRRCTGTCREKQFKFAAVKKEVVGVFWEALTSLYG